jgi:hypothetical protein
MSTISASTTTTTAFKITTDTTGALVFQTGASPTTAVTFNASQNVGIGTSSPSSKLHLNVSSGTVQQQFTNGGTSTYIGIDSGFTGFDIAAGGGIRFRYFNGSAYAEGMRLDTSGNFGIGINAPTQKLDVYGTGMKVNNASYVGYLGAGNTFAGGSASDFCVRSDNVLSFATGGPYERARIDTSGNLLVGATSISGTSADNRIVGIYGAGTSNRAQLRLTNSNTGTTSSDGTALSVDSTSGFYITQYENASVVIETNGANERMRVDPSGRVLIGASSSQTVVGNQLTLQVHGTGFGSATTGLNVTSWYSDVGYGGNLVLAHVRSGTVGTQTATVSGTELGTILFAGSTGSATSQGATITGWSSDSTWTGSSTPAYLSFYTAPAGSTANLERMRINSSGQIVLPYQPAFMATVQASTFTPPTSGTYNYSSVKLNRGSHYNSSNGRFTVPVTGVYYFCHVITARPTSTAVIEPKIYVNGGELARGFVSGAGSVPNGMASLTISLSANDYVEAAFYNGNSPAVVLSGSDDITPGSNGIVSGFMGWFLG